MLALLPEPDCSFRQVLVKWRKADRLFNHTIEIQSSAHDKKDFVRFCLYVRRNCHRADYEAGIVYFNGSRCPIWDSFPIEMLRIFSVDKDTCFELANGYYTKLIQKFHLSIG
jgi:hypothetical protein